MVAVPTWTGWTAAPCAQGLKASVLEQLQASLEIADPGGVLIPTGAGEHFTGVGLVKHQRNLVVVQPRLIRIGPQELVDRAEAAAHDKTVPHQPALQELAFESIGIVGHHGQAGRAGHGRIRRVGISVVQIHGNQEFVFGSRRKGAG